MRTLLLIVLLCGCDTISKVTTLEARVTILEKRLNAAMAADFNAEDAREAKMRACLDSADDAYWRYVQLNGRKKPGTEIWSAATSVFEHASRLKQAATEECRLLNAR